jgi:predicted HTH domain antitoxin
MDMLVTLKVPQEAIRLFGNDAAHFGREMFEAAVVQWYDEGRISSGKGAELLDLSRAEFLELLSRHNVTPFQYSAKELAAEMNRG